MQYPDYFTAEDIMEFEYEYNRLRDIEDGVGFWAVNAELQEIADKEREMSMSDLMIDLQDEIRLGALSFAEIARKYEVPTSWVNEAWELLCEQEAEAEQFFDQGFHDELERDHDEPYEPEGGEDAYLDSWYEDQYDLGDYDYA